MTPQAEEWRQPEVRALRGSFQNHHLIPRVMVRRAQIEAFLLGLRGFSLECQHANRLLLPAREELAATLGMALHRGPHPHFSEVVAARLERLRQAWLRGADLPEELAMLRARLRIARLQRVLARLLTGRGPRLLLLNRRDPMHLFADYAALDAAIDAVGGNWSETHN